MKNNVENNHRHHSAQRHPEPPWPGSSPGTLPASSGPGAGSGAVREWGLAHFHTQTREEREFFLSRSCKVVCLKPSPCSRVSFSLFSWDEPPTVGSELWNHQSSNSPATHCPASGGFQSCPGGVAPRPARYFFAIQGLKKKKNLILSVTQGHRVTLSSL